MYSPLDSINKLDISVITPNCLVNYPMDIGAGSAAATSTDADANDNDADVDAEDDDDDDDLSGLESDARVADDTALPVDDTYEYSIFVSYAEVCVAQVLDRWRGVVAVTCHHALVFLGKGDNSC